jgi:hypothetical protein
MQTIWQLVQNMYHSTPEGYVGVIGIFLFFACMIGAGAYRVKEMMEHEDEHH